MQKIVINGIEFPVDVFEVEFRQYGDEIVVCVTDPAVDRPITVARIPITVWRTASIRVEGSHYVEIANGENTRIIASDLALEV